jgi:hypothetical protein
MLCNFKRNRFSNRPYLPPVIEVMIIHINMTTMSIFLPSFTSFGQGVSEEKIKM